MRIVRGRDILESVGKVDAACITTNCQLRHNNDAVMGAGVALAFATRYPQLPRLLGNHIAMCHRGVDVITTINDTDIVALPTKENWRYSSSPDFVLESCRLLVALADKHGWKTITLPPPGCGLGGLKWAQLRPILDTLLDGRFWVVFK